MNMLETLKKKSGKSRLTRAIVSIIVVIGLLALTKFAIFDVITGPTKLDLTSSPVLMKGNTLPIDVENYLTVMWNTAPQPQIPHQEAKAPG